MEEPLVSVICLCYNQRQFVNRSIQSVLDQNYTNIEVIVVDDASTDGSQAEIIDFLEDKPETHFLALKENLGNTGAFNKGLALTNGKYVIDLACDDLLLSNRISSQVDFFESQPKITGVIYSDAEYINQQDQVLGRHFEDPRWSPHEGNIYAELVSGYFIHPTTMMIKKNVLDGLGGYDTNLAYEDFDFWVRSARIWNYAYQDMVLTKIRKVEGSHGSTLYNKYDKKLLSTVIVCKKIHKMNQSSMEHLALAIRLKYEIKHSFLTGNKIPTSQFINILSEIDVLHWKYRLLTIFNWGIDFSSLRRLALKIKYGRIQVS